jgi:hypothetical protein
MEAIDLMTVVTVALLGSLGHCSGMCGGFVVAYTVKKIEQTDSPLNRNFRHLLYNLGRVASYTLIGGASGFLGATLSITRIGEGVALLAIALVMVLIGHGLLGKSRFLQWLEARTPFQKQIRSGLQAIIHSKSKRSFFELGFVNGFLPCGFVYFFVFAAASTGGVVDGALIMFVFGVATIPVLLALANTVTFVQKFSLRNYAGKLAGWIVILYGYWIAYRGYVLLMADGAACH